jgi:predicted MPP superfamily phosphohydrolase
VLLVAGFYAAEAQMVFLFPEALLGRRVPWRSSRAMTVAAGGTLQVMVSVLPIAARMLGTGWWRGHGSRSWVQGCLAVVLWHRHVAKSCKPWVEEVRHLPRGEIGPVHPLLLRREAVLRHAPGKFRVLWISDLHWRGMADAGMLLALRALSCQERPDLIVLGGDFLESRKALPLFARLVRCLVRVAPCVAMPGNHDRGRFHRDLKDAVRNGGGIWLPDEPGVEVTEVSGHRLVVAGVKQIPAGGKEPLLILAHDPAEVDGVALPPGSIVLAGHLHGGQFVFSATSMRLLPAAWFYRHAWLRRHLDGVDWIVSRGAGDTLPLRWNCPREVVFCEIG